MCYNRSIMKDLFEQFWSKVVVKQDSCWEWHGAKDRHGYGQIRSNKKLILAHRYSWLIHYYHVIGDIPDGMCVLHRCDNPECCNPEHLFLGTMQDNSRDMMNKGRGRGQFTGYINKPICKYGHEKPIGISCPTCQRIYGKRYKQKLINERPPKYCPVCGKQFPDYRGRTYCSKECKWTAGNRRRDGKPIKSSAI